MSSSLLMTPTTSRGHTHQVAPPPEEISQTLEQLKDAFLDYLDGNVVRANERERGREGERGKGSEVTTFLSRATERGECVLPAAVSPRAVLSPWRLGG